MNKQVRGVLARPRVAVIGEMDEHIHNYLLNLFPTIWGSPSLYKLIDQVDYREIDLLIFLESSTYIIDDYEPIENYIDNCHVICFSSSVEFQGPIPNTIIDAEDISTTGEYLFPDIPLPMNRQRESDFSEVRNIRGFHVVRVRDIYGQPKLSQVDREKIFNNTYETLSNGALVLERATKLPIAVIYVREINDLRVAILPNRVFSLNWIEILCNQWAETDRERFPNFGNWQKNPEWMTRQEIFLAAEIEKVEAQRQEAHRSFALKLAELSAGQLALAESSNKGLRKLITAQGRELVDEVASVFREFGFVVQILDDDIDPDKSKFEDLRLTIPGENNWEAIVEVRGYSRSSGQTQDFQRLGRFATKFFKEKGKLPEKRILVVNGEIEILNPSNRQLPYSAAKDDLEAFAEDDGIVIWSLDLFRQVNRIGEVPYEEIRKSIIESKGQWQGYQSEPK